MRIVGGLTRGSLSLTLIAALALPLPALAAQGRPSDPAASGLNGLILGSSPGPDAGESLPVIGAVVMARNVTAGTVYESGRTDASGAYGLTGLPAGSYELAIRTGERVYLSDGVVTLAAGEPKRVSFTLRDEADEEDEGEGEGEEEGGEEGGEGEAPPPDRTVEAARRLANFWSEHPWLAGFSVVGTALTLGVLVDQLTEEDKQKEKKASPSGPDR